MNAISREEMAYGRYWGGTESAVDEEEGLGDGDDISTGETETVESTSDGRRTTDDERRVEGEDGKSVSDGDGGKAKHFY